MTNKTIKAAKTYQDFYDAAHLLQSEFLGPSTLPTGNRKLGDSYSKFVCEIFPNLI